MSIISPLPQSMQYKDTLTLLERDVSVVKKSNDIIFAQLHILMIEKTCSSCNFDFLFLFWNFGPLNLKKFNNLLNNFFGIPENCQIFK